ncbi:MAG: hypothetical protein JXA22_10675 [Candidatus Thermoplasmatota archaeon]|nr:hypothetical protein [Candidatus Thermoplasmatota archaeon]
MRRTMDRNGGMEGVPLQLIIAVVVGMAALGIVIGWLAIASDTDANLKRITTDPETVEITGEGRVNLTVAITVYVYDSEGNEVDDVIVTFSGAVDSKVVQKIDSGDPVEVQAVIPSSADTAVIDIKAEKGGGMGSTDTTVIVMRG